MKEESESTREIFIFGSNTEGRHGKGAALYARQHYGAIYGQAEGLQGNAYGIITKELRRGYPRIEISKVAEGVQQFIEFASIHPELSFIVSPIGCGLAGFKPEQIAPLFNKIPCNVKLPKEFKDVL